MKWEIQDINSEIFYLYRSSSIMAMESRRLQWAGHAVQIVKTMNGPKICKLPLGRTKRWKHYFRMEMGYDDGR